MKRGSRRLGLLAYCLAAWWSAAALPEKAAAESSYAPPASDAPASAAENDAPEPEGSEESSGEEPEPPPSGGASSFWSDPTLGGKLHLTYRILYTARIYQFHSYEQPFPVTTQSSSAIDDEQADAIRERHKDISDQELDQYFSLHLEQLPVLEGRSKVIQSAGGEASFRYFKDIDGSPAGEEAHGFFDRYDGRQAFQLATLNTRVEALDRHLELIAGRQYGREAEWLHFDGGTATLRGLEVFGQETELTGFAGSRVYFYSRSESPWSGLAPQGEGIYGGHWKTWLFESTRLRVSDVYYIDNSLEMEARHDFSPEAWASLVYRMVNEDPHSVLLEGAWDWLQHTFALYFFYVGKLGTNADDFNFDYTQSSRKKSFANRDIYFNIGDIAPYDELTLELRKGIWTWLGVYGGGTVHRLRQRSAEDNYNTDWQEAWLGVDATDPLWKGLTGRALVRYVHTDLPRRQFRLNVDDTLNNGVPDFQAEDATGTGEPSYLGVEALIEQDFQRKVAVGATAVLRAYNQQSNFAELDGLTASSLGAYVRWRTTAWTQLYLSYAYDTDYRYFNPDLDALHTLRLQFQVKF